MLRDRPGLASCAVHCRHCGIRFLTHPRNANRGDLGCPFGCREHHRRRRANQRSRKHYRTDEGRRSKKRLNGKRSAAGRPTPGAGPDVEADATPASTGDAPSASVGPRSRPAAPSADPAGRPTRVRPAEVSRVNVNLSLEGFTLDEGGLATSRMLPYLATVATVLEGRAIDHEELLRTLLRSMRRRCFDRLPRREYVLRFPARHPP